MAYIDGFVLAVPEKNLAQYRKLARLGAKVWKEHGALEYRECLAADLAPGFGVSFAKAVKAKPGETVFFSWIMYKSRAHRDRVNAKAMKDPRMAKSMEQCMGVFDCKRMVCGGFKVFVSA